MPPRTPPREETLDLELGLMRFRWGDWGPKLKKACPDSYSAPRFELRAFGQLKHLRSFLTVEGVTLQAVVENPQYGSQSLWLEVTGEHPPEVMVALRAAVLRLLGCTPDNQVRDEYGEACWKGERWGVYTELSEDYLVLMIACETV
jgi:hypothetical protein